RAYPEELREGELRLKPDRDRVPGPGERQGLVRVRRLRTNPAVAHTEHDRLVILVDEVAADPLAADILAASGDEPSGRADARGRNRPGVIEPGAATTGSDDPAVIHVRMRTFGPEPVSAPRSCRRGRSSKPIRRSPCFSSLPP